MINILPYHHSIYFNKLIYNFYYLVFNVELDCLVEDYCYVENPLFQLLLVLDVLSLLNYLSQYMQSVDEINRGFLIL